MALVQVFQVTESQDGTIVYVNDETGDYDASSNTGGYGAPNTERTDLALIILGKYKASTGDTSFSFAAYDPEIVTQFSVTGLDTDGRHEYKVYSVPRSGTEGAAVLNKFRYDFSTNQLERYNGSTWVTAANADLETYEYTNTTVDWPHIPDLSKAIHYLNKLRLIGSQSAKDTDLKAFLDQSEVVKYGVISLFGEGSFADAQEAIEEYQSRVDTILELT